MTDAERLTYLKMIQEDIYVCSLDATFLHISKECALTATIKELEKKISDNAQKVDTVPMSVITEIKAEIIEMRKRDPLYYYVATEDILDWVLNTIDRKVKEHET